MVRVKLTFDVKIGNYVPHKNTVENDEIGHEHLVMFFGWGGGCTIMTCSMSIYLNPCKI